MRVETITFEDLGGGIDRSGGLITRDARKLYSANNYVITQGRKLRRRPPNRKDAGQIAANVQGYAYLNGRDVVVAKRGDTVTHTITGAAITTVYFDAPEGSTEWDLVELMVFNEQVVAVIRHLFPTSAAASWRNFLHVWDDKRPTYVTDPACPTSWSPSLPLHPYGKGESGGYVDYRPRMIVAGERLAITTPNGDVAFSGANAPRIWNQRAASDILANGEMWYTILGNAPGNHEVIIPVPFFDLIQAGKYAAYVCEYLTNGEWRQYREVNTLVNLGDYTLAAIPNRFDPLGAPETKLTLTLGADGTVVRFRALARPAATILSGLYPTPNGTVVGGILTHEGSNHEVATYQAGAGMTAGQDYQIAVAVPGAPIAIPTVALGGFGAQPLNGQQRYWSRIVAVAEAASATAFTYAITGTVTVVAGSTRIVGVGTTFTDDLQVGRQVEVNGERRVVKAVADDTLVEVDAPFTAPAAGVTALADIRYRYAADVGDSGNPWYAEREAAAAFEQAGADDALVLATSLSDDSGGVPVALAAMQNRLLVQYPSILQSWSTGPSAKDDFRLLSTLGQGAGINSRPQPVLIDGFAGLPTVAGPRLFAPSGNNKDYIEFMPVGDKLKGIPIPDLRRAVWWPRMRVWVECAADGGGNLFVLSVHRESKVIGWTTWSLPGITNVDAMFVRGEVLVIVSGRDRYRMDPDDPVYVDDNDGTGTPYASTVRWLYNTLGHPSKNKKLIRCEIAQVGKARLSVFMNPRALTEESIGPTANGNTMGLQRVPLAVMGPGVGLAMESTDPTGHEIESVGFDYQLLNR